MKVRVCLIAAIMMAASVVFSCKEIDKAPDILSDEVASVTFTVDSFEVLDEEAISTRIVLDNNNMILWSQGDTVGIYPDQGSQVYFVTESNNDGLTAVFDGGGWSFKQNISYRSYYPFIGDMYLDQTCVPVSFTGQKQVGIENSSHISPFLSMYTDSATPEGSHLNFVFHHLCCIIRPVLTLPAGTYTKLAITAPSAVFATKGSYNLTAESCAIEPTVYTNQLLLDLEGITLTEETTFRVYLVSAPVNLVGVEITVSVLDSQNVERQCIRTPGSVYDAGKIAKITCSTWTEASEEDRLIVEDNTGGNDPGQFTASKYLTFTSEGTTNVRLRSFGDNSNNVDPPVVYYSTDKVNWIQWDLSDMSDLIVTDMAPLYICGDNPSGFTKSVEPYYRFVTSGDAFAVSGDIMSLINKDEDVYTIPSNYCFESLFSNCVGLTSAPALPATQLAMRCYHLMFRGCTSLTTAPELPATDLAFGCYYSMFRGCTSLTTAPELPATTLEERCYERMFLDCSNLSTVKALFTTTPDNTYTPRWLEGVAATGTFIKSPDATWDVTGVNGIPEGWTVVTDGEGDIKYLTFTSDGTTTISLSNTGDNAPVIYHSTDKTNWTLWDYSALTFTDSAPLYMYGDNPNGFSWSDSKCSSFVATGDQFDVNGDIMSLIDAHNEVVEIPNDYCFSKLFMDCALLHTAPALPATTLTTACFLRLFSGCTSLTTAPTLPAVTLANSCYGAMFSGCTSLITAPTLPATTLATFCYDGMFEGCISLTSAPALPATSLSIGCYWSMFMGCSSLTNAPALTATSLAQYCYKEMFSGCTSLSTAPALPATTLAPECYYLMFSGCTNLSTAPALPATTLANSCYYGMFWDCTSLTIAPELPATDLAGSCYKRMFSNCSSLATVKALFTTTPGTSFTGNWLDGVAATGTFIKSPDATWEVTGVNGIPEGWTVLTDGEEDMKYLTFTSDGTTTISLNNTGDNAPVIYHSMDKVNWTLWDYSELTFTSSAPLYMYGNNPGGFSWSYSKYSSFVATGNQFGVQGDIMSLINAYNDVLEIPSSCCFAFLFAGCSLLHTAPALLATTLAEECYGAMFSCTSLTTAPALPATTMAISCYRNMFFGCTSLTAAPALPGTTLAENCYDSMFEWCTSLATAPALPVTTLSDYCYYRMFYGCTSLSKAPDLPATTLNNSCYSSMFEGCTSLTTASALPATTLMVYCYNRMFAGCTSLTTAPTLPATILAKGCYYSMFSGCTSLTTAPTLNATALESYCYSYMFNNCSNLSSVTCLAHNGTYSYLLDEMYNWLAGVASTGILVVAPGTTWWNSNGIVPNGWSIEYIQN